MCVFLISQFFGAHRIPIIDFDEKLIDRSVRNSSVLLILQTQSKGCRQKLITLPVQCSAPKRRQHSRLRVWDSAAGLSLTLVCFQRKRQGGAALPVSPPATAPLHGHACDCLLRRRACSWQACQGTGARLLRALLLVASSRSSRIATRTKVKVSRTSPPQIAG